MRRVFSTSNKRKDIETSVCIVGTGPVGMTMSSLLNHFKVPNVILEKHPSLHDHPKAHYLSFRTCEILKDLGLSQTLERDRLKKIRQWTNFNYQTHVLGGKVYGKVNHFSEDHEHHPQTYADRLLEFKKEFTYAYPNHLSQNKLNKLYLNKLEKQGQRVFYSHQYLSHQKKDHVEVKIKDKQLDKDILINCDYLIGADGVNSKIRQDLGISLSGNHNIQNFVNIHFRAPDLGKLMLSNDQTGMLFFIYNKDVVSVLVCHDIEEGEFVLQVPYFPPIETLDDYKDENRCLDIVKKSVFSQEVRQSRSVDNIKIKVANVNTWKMEAVVAQSYCNIGGKSPYAFLAGDAAHAFPPSGGFGMNTGVGDAFNLAHKLAYVSHNKGTLSPELSAKILQSYSDERRYVGNVTQELAMINYQKSVKVASMLNLNVSYADTFTNAVERFLPDFVDKKQILNFGMSMGRNIAQASVGLTTQEQNLKQFLTSSRKNSIMLLFPNLDFSYSYPSLNHYNDQQLQRQFLLKNFDSEEYEPYSEVGSLVPHVRLINHSCFSLRQLMSSVCLEQGRSLLFYVFLSDKPSLDINHYQGEYSQLDQKDKIIIKNKSAKLPPTRKGECQVIELEFDSVDFSRLKNMHGPRKMLVFRGDGHLIFKQ